MRTSNIALSLVAIGKISSGSSLHHTHPAFIPHIRPNDSNKLYGATNDNYDALFEAEEAAAVDAHDVSDPGVEGAAMERAVIMAAELKEDLQRKIEEDHKRKPSSLVGKIKSFFHHDEASYASEASDAEANFAHDLSDTAALEHANEIPIADEDKQALDPTNDALFEAEEAAAIDAHDVSDPGIEGAAMERAVIMAAELKEELQRKEDSSAMEAASDAEANFAHDLSDTAAMEHANEVSVDEDRIDVDDTYDAFFEAEEAAAIDAHDVSDPGIEGAAMERAVIMAAEFQKVRGTVDEEENEQDVLDANEAEATYARRLSDVAALEHAKMVAAAEDEASRPLKKKGKDRIASVNEAEATYARRLSDVAALEHAKMVAAVEDEASGPLKKTVKDRIASVEEHYKSIDKDIHTIEHLIQEADKADRSEGHSLERTFSDDDAADLALMMIEKSVVACQDKLELCQKKAEQTELEVKIALEEKYSAKALAESIERERRAAEMRFLATEHFSDDADVLERKRDSSILHADNALLSDALKQEHDAELKLEQAIEHDIAAKRELEQMIENKSALKQELHDLEHIIHERTASLWEKENAKNKLEQPDEAKKEHHFDWWHRRW